MKLHQFVLRQGMRNILRTPGRSALLSLLVLLSVLLLGISLGLTRTVREALRHCEEKYTTIAVVEYLSGESDTPPSEIAALSREFSELPLPAAVLHWEPEQLALGYFPETDAILNHRAVKDQAVLVVRIPAEEKPKDGSLTGLVERTLFSRREVTGRFIELATEDLLPGSTYLLCGRWYEGRNLGGFLAPMDDPAPLRLEGPEALDAPECSIFFQRAEALEVQLHSVTVQASERLEELYPFQQGLARVEEGRMFTVEEETSGAAVCLLSDTLAELTGFGVGDSVTLCLAVGEDLPLLESYQPEVGFQRTETYTVVGLFHAQADWAMTVFLPPPVGLDLTANHCSTTLGQMRVENSSAGTFLQKMDRILPSALRLTLYDQGYGEATAPLRTMLRTVGLITAACLVLGGCFLGLTAWSYLSRQRGDLLLMERLGVTAGAQRLALLSGLGLLALPVGLAGGAISFAFSGLAWRLLSGGMSGLSDDRRFSQSQIVTEAVTGTAPGALFYLSVAAGVLVLLLGLCLVLSLPRPMRHSGRGGRTLSPRPSKKLMFSGARPSLKSGWGYARISMARGGFRTGLPFLAAFCAVLLFAVLGRAETGNRAQLVLLRKEGTVRGSFTDLYGRQSSGLALPYTAIFPVLDLEATRSATVTGQGERYKYAGRSTGKGVDHPPEIPRTELAAVMAARTYLDEPSLIGANSLELAPQFLYSGGPELSWASGYDEGILGSLVPDCVAYLTPEEPAPPFSSEAAVPCVVSTAFLREHGLALGEEFCVSLPPENPGLVCLRRYVAVGSYVKPAGRDHIYYPLSVDLDMTLYDREGEVYRSFFGPVEIAPGMSLQFQGRAGSAVFRFSCADLSALKEALQQAGLTETGSRAGVRQPFLLEDGVFLATLQTAERRLWYMERIFPVIVLLGELLALVLSILSLRSRQREVTLMRRTGVPTRTAFFSLYLEQLVLSAGGTALSLGIGFLLRLTEQASITQGLLFFALWMAGALLSLEIALHAGWAAGKGETA